MIYPIVVYGNPVLRRQAQEISENYSGLLALIADMFETLEHAHGVGLAAPQINLSIRLVVIDASPFGEVDPKAVGFKKAFINPVILEEEGEPWAFNEGCLSFPGLYEDVFRKPNIRVSYRDENGQEHEQAFDGMIARIIQHECDHLNGKTFVDRLNPLRKTLLRRRLDDISKGEVKTSYRVDCARKTKSKRV
ncbi:MAG: peptide deformylase [Bacteroidales bacterium]